MCDHHHSLVLDYLITLKRNHIHIHCHSPLPHVPSPGQSLICFLSLQICLFWTFQINRVIQYENFCVWLLSFSIMFSRFTHVIACISALFLLPDTVPVYGFTIFCLSTHQLSYGPDAFSGQKCLCLEPATTSCKEVCRFQS